MDIPLYSVLTFCSTLMLSVTWNLGGSNVLEYMTDLVMLILILFITSTTLNKNYEINLFFSLITITGILYSVLSIASVLVGERASLLLGGPNVTVRIIFLGLLAYVQVKKNQTYNSVIIIVLLTGIVSTGSRGGIIATLICLTLYLAINIISKFNLQYKRKISLTILVKALLLSVILYYAYEYFEDEINLLVRSRITETLIDNFHLAGRDELFEKSLSIISTNIYWGQGLSAYYDNAVGFHPHNLFIQLYLDVGLLSFVNIVVIIIALVYFLINRRIIIYYAIPFYIIVHMVSGSYYDLRYMFLFWMLGNFVRKINRET